MSNPNPVASWKPGQCGNPNGRPPKECSITETVKDMMKKNPEIKKALATKIFELALKKDDLAALKMVWQYMDGMPNQKIDLEGTLESSPLEKVAQDVRQILTRSVPTPPTPPNATK